MEEKKRSRNSSTPTPALLRDKEIAIIGGGPAGLVLAKVLQLRGASVKVYEREASRHYRIQGSSLDMHAGAGLAAIKAAGLSKEFSRVAIPDSDSMRMMDHLGVTHLHVPALKLAAFRPEVERGDLRDIFLNSLDPETVVWDAHFLSLRHLEDQRVELSFADGKKVVVDLVVGADGANSRIRPHLTPIRPSYSGMTMITAEVSEPKYCPKIVEWLEHGFLIIMGGGSCIFVHERTNGNLVFYVSFKCSENWLPECGIDWKSGHKIKSYLQSTYSSWHPAVHAMFTAADDTSFVPRQMIACPIQQSWEPQPNITLIGDSAHVMPPYAGEGANMAMLDGLELANRLTSGKYTTLRDAIASFEKDMFTRMKSIAQETKSNGEALHSSGGVTAFKRQTFGRILGFLVGWIKYVIWGINWITDFLRITKKERAPRRIRTL